MKIAQEQFNDFLNRWAFPFMENAHFKEQRLGQAFINHFQIKDPLISPWGDVWEIHDKKDVESMVEWLYKKFVE